MENEVSEKRKLELSKMLFKMGKALVDEGLPLKDYITMQTGNTFILLSSLILKGQEMYIFGEITSMFLAKKRLEELEKLHVTKGNDSVEKFIESLSINEDKPIKKVTKKKPPKDDATNS